MSGPWQASVSVSQSVSHQSHGSHQLGAWFQLTHQPNLPSSLYVQAAFHLHQPPPLSWIRSEIFHSHAVMCAVSSVWNAGESFIICGEGLLKYYLFFIFISNPLLHENISSPAIFWISMAFSYITHSYLVLSLFHLHLFCLTPPPPDTHWTVNSCILLFFFFFLSSVLSSTPCMQWADIWWVEHSV